MADMEVGNLVAKISMDDTGITQSMASLNRSMKVVQSEFQAASAKLGDFGKSSEGLRLKADSLTKQIGIQQQTVAKLREEHNKSVEAKGADARETQNLEVKMNKASAQLSKMEGELKTTNKEIDAQSGFWNKVNKSMDAASVKMKDVGKKFTDVGKGMALKVTAPILAVGGAAIKASVDFESAFAGVRKTVDATEAEFKVLSKGIRDMSKEIPAAATDIAKVAEAAGQLGIKTPNILKFTRTMIDLGESTNLSSEQAATSFARFANIVGMGQENFDRLGSSTVALGNSMATTEAEIVNMSMKLAAQGKQVGMSESQIFALAATMSSLGVEADAGGTAMTTVLKKIQTAVGEGGKALDAFAKAARIDSKDFAAAWNADPIKALEMFTRGLGQSGSEGKNLTSILNDLGIKGIRESDTIMRLAGASDLLADAVDTSSRAWEENTALATEAEQRYGTTESQLKIFWNRTKDVAVTLGDALVPAMMKALDALNPLIDTIARAADWFANLDDSTQTTIITFTAMVAATAPVLIAIGAVIKSLATLTIAIKGVGLAMTAITKNPWVAVITAALALLILAGTYLYTNWDTVRINMLKIFDSLSTGVANAMSWMKIKVLEATLGVYNALAKVSDFIPGMTDKVDKAREGFANMIDIEKTKQQTRTIESQMKQATYAIQLQEVQTKKLEKASGEATVAIGTFSNAVAEETKVTKHNTVAVKGLSEERDESTRSSKKNTDAVKESTKVLKENAEAAKEAEREAQKMRDETIRSLNDFNNAVKSALKTRFAEQERVIVESLQRQVDEHKKSSQEIIRGYDDEYKAKLKTLDLETQMELQAIQDQIDGINNQTKAEEKELEEQAYQKRLADKVKEMSEAETAEARKKIQEELSAMLVERERKQLLDQRQIQISALNSAMDRIKKDSQQKQEILQIEYNAKKTNEENMAKATETNLLKQMEYTKKHYAELMAEEAIQAEVRKMMLEQNNLALIDLLEMHNPKWRDAGQSFGESLLDGLNSKKASIQASVNEMMALVGATGAIPASKSSSSSGGASKPAVPVPSNLSNEARYLTSLIQTGNAGQQKWAESQAKSYGLSVTNGIVQGMQSGIAKVQQTATAIGTAIEDGVKNKLQIKSPSRVMMSLGKFTGEGLAAGMRETLAGIRRQAAALAQAAIPGMDALSIPSGQGALATQRSGATQGGTSVTQNLVINSTAPLSPAETARKNLQTARQLAMEWG